MKTLFPAVLVLALAFSGCKKDETPTPVTPTPSPAIRVSFTNVVGADPLALGGPNYYINAHGDSFYVTTYKYYVSNIKFTDNNGNTWSEPESYHLINAADPNSLSFNVSGMPAATYTSMQFMIGVDSARNVSGAQTGALDPANDMFWTWNTGYIMAKFEGKSPQSTASAHNLTFHIAGYSGANAVQRIVSPTFASLTANPTATLTPVIHIKSDVLEWFVNPNTIRFDTMNNVATTGASAMQIADNYADMFTITGIDN